MKGKLLLLTVVVGMIVAPAGGGDARTFAGSFEWTGGNATGDLAAEFSPKAEGTWDVTFRFKFRDRDHVYAGTAEGSLTEGALSGKVQNEEKSRTWTFEGTFDGGSFRGTHAEIEDGEAQATGTLSLRGA